MTLKQSYQEWKQCIFADGNQPFTKEFIKQRLTVLRDIQHPEYKKFVTTYGKEYTEQIIMYFEQAFHEAQ